MPPLQVLASTTSSLETKHTYQVFCLRLTTATAGQKLCTCCQKMVAALMPDRLSGGKGSVNGILTSGSIISRTVVQNLTHASLLGLAFATGQGPLRLKEGLSSEQLQVRDVMHSYRHLSASSLQELRRRTPRMSLSNEHSLISWRSGRLLGKSLQGFLPLYSAKQGSGNPNGSINGLGERGGLVPGCIHIDPIATASWREKVLEEHEVVGFDPEKSTACSTCGKLSLNGACECYTDERDAKRARRGVNLNPIFHKTCSHLASANLDVHVTWRAQATATASSRTTEPPCQDPEDLAWKAVPHKRRGISMLDLLRRLPEERMEEYPRQLKIWAVAPGGCDAISFGPSPCGRIVSQQLEFAMRRRGHGVAWQSGDRSEGHTRVVFRGRDGQDVHLRALEEAAKDMQKLSDELDEVLTMQHGDFHGSAAERLVQVTPTLWLAIEPGGTLQLQTTDERTKELLLGALDYGGSVMRCARAYLLEDVSLPLLDLVNPAYSCKGTCNEHELRLMLQRNLGYLFLATTLAALPLRREICSMDQRVLEAFFSLDAVSADLGTSDIYISVHGTQQRVFHSHVILGPNPRARGWLDPSVERIPLKLLVHVSRVDKYPTAWNELPMLTQELIRNAVPPQELDPLLTASTPALVAISARVVFEVKLRSGKEPPKASICGQGVFDDLERGLTSEALKHRSQLYCINCGDCTGSTMKSEQKLEDRLMDIEDVADVSAMHYALRHQARMDDVQEPSVKVHRTKRWAFQCYTNEDLGLNRRSAALPLKLEEIPGVAVLLADLPPPTEEQRRAEREYLTTFYQTLGGAPADLWYMQATGALRLLVQATRDLARAMRMLSE